MRIRIVVDGHSHETDSLRLEGAPAERCDPSRYTVKLEGVDVSAGCLMADDEIGEVEVHSRNADGAYFKNEAGDAIAREIKRGKVEIFYDGDAV